MNVPEIQHREAQPAMVMREEVGADEIGPVLYRILPAVWGYIQELDGTPGGAPFTRFLGFAESGRMIIEAGVPTLDALPSSADMQSIVLDGGPCVTLIHVGCLDLLGEAHAQLDEWFETTGHQPAGFRWEAYLTDPGAEPDTSKWRTLITQALEPKE